MYFLLLMSLFQKWFVSMSLRMDAHWLCLSGELVRLCGTHWPSFNSLLILWRWVIMNSCIDFIELLCHFLCCQFLFDLESLIINWSWLFRIRASYFSGEGVRLPNWNWLTHCWHILTFILFPYSVQIFLTVFEADEPFFFFFFFFLKLVRHAIPLESMLNKKFWENKYFYSYLYRENRCSINIYVEKMDIYI